MMMKLYNRGVAYVDIYICNSNMYKMRISYNMYKARTIFNALKCQDIPIPHCLITSHSMLLPSSRALCIVFEAYPPP